MVVNVDHSSGVREAISVLTQGLKCIEAQPECYEAASIYAALAYNHAVMDDYDVANSWAEKARQVGEKTENFEAMAWAMATQGAFLTDTGRIDEGLPLWEQALNLALQHENYVVALSVLGNLGMYTYPRDLIKAREIMVRHLELCKRVNNITLECEAWAWLAFLDWLRGDWRIALGEVQTTTDLIERLALPTPNLLRAHVAWSLGDLEQAEKDLQKALENIGQNSKITQVVETYLLKSLLRLEQGRRGEARTCLERCVEAFRKSEFTTDPLLHIEVLFRLTEIHATNGELERARDCYLWAERIAETLHAEAGLGMACQAEGSLLLASGDMTGSEKAYLKCLAHWEKSGWVYYYAKALFAYSEAIAKSNPEKFKNLVQEAAEIFKKLGAKLDLEKAEAKRLAK